MREILAVVGSRHMCGYQIYILLILYIEILAPLVGSRHIWKKLCVLTGRSDAQHRATGVAPVGTGV